MTNEKRELLSLAERKELATNPVPAFMHYQGQVAPQRAFILISPEADYPISIGYNTDPSNSTVSFSTWAGREYELVIEPATTGKSLLNFIDQHADKFWQVVEGYYTESDGERLRGKYSNSASDIIQQLEHLTLDELEVAQVWHDINSLDLESDITAETDAATLAQETLEWIEGEGQVAVFDKEDLIEYIRERQRELAEDN